jgi:hypothetical protein
VHTPLHVRLQAGDLLAREDLAWRSQGGDYFLALNILSGALSVNTVAYLHFSLHNQLLRYTIWCRLRLKCDGTRAETRFRLSAKRTSPFKVAGASVQSTTGSRVVRINGSNGSNARYTMFRGTQSIRSFPFTTPPVRYPVPSQFNWSLHLNKIALRTWQRRSMISKYHNFYSTDTGVISRR